MRWGACIITVIVLSIVLLLASGCAMDSKRQTHAAMQKMDEPTTVPVEYTYLPSAAGSLVFDPPVTLGQPPLELSREIRNPDAFVAYEGESITYFYLRTDDRQLNDRNDRYDRRAITTKVGVSFR